MKLTQKNIEEYIDRFLEGETTNDEERAIYRFFREEKVPVHLQEYAPMFAWYEGGMQEETVITKKRFHLPIEVWSIGIAAMITIIKLPTTLPMIDPVRLKEILNGRLNISAAQKEPSNK